MILAAYALQIVSQGTSMEIWGYGWADYRGH